MRRREFLQALGATGAAAALSPLSAISLEDDWYVNSSLGLALRKPPGWHFMSVVDFDRLIDRQQNEFEEDGDLLRKLREVSSQPILVITKYDPIPDEGVCPTIQIYASPPEPDSPEHGLFLSAIGAHSGLGGMLRDYRPESFPAEEELAGLDVEAVGRPLGERLEPFHRHQTAVHNARENLIKKT